MSEDRLPYVADQHAIERIGKKSVTPKSNIVWTGYHLFRIKGQLTHHQRGPTIKWNKNSWSIQGPHRRAITFSHHHDRMITSGKTFALKGDHGSWSEVNGRRHLCKILNYDSDVLDWRCGDFVCAGVRKICENLINLSLGCRHLRIVIEPLANPISSFDSDIEFERDVDQLIERLTLSRPRRS